MPYPALAPINPAPRTCISRIAVAICSTVATSSITKSMRQKSLINQLNHAFIVRLAPDGPEMFTANFHNPEDGLRAGHHQRRSD